MLELGRWRLVAVSQGQVTALQPGQQSKNSKKGKEEKEGRKERKERREGGKEGRREGMNLPVVHHLV